jgi:hypothetical protein
LTACFRPRASAQREGIVSYMYMCVCCVCVCVCRPSVKALTRTHNTRTHQKKNTHTHPRTYIHTRTHTQVNIYIHIHTYKHTYIHTHIHTYIYIYIHICTSPMRAVACSSWFMDSCPANKSLSSCSLVLDKDCSCCFISRASSTSFWDSAAFCAHFRASSVCEDSSF